MGRGLLTASWIIAPGFITCSGGFPGVADEVGRLPIILVEPSRDGKRECAFKSTVDE